MAIDEQAIVDTVTFGYGEVANSYVPKGALYYYADNLKRPYDPEKAKADAGRRRRLRPDAQLRRARRRRGRRADRRAAAAAARQGRRHRQHPEGRSQPGAGTCWWPATTTSAVNYWTNDILDPDQKTTFVLGHDANMNYMTRYNNDEGQGAGRGGAHRDGPGQARADVYRPAEDGEGGRQLDRPLLQPLSSTSRARTSRISTRTRSAGSSWKTSSRTRLAGDSAGRRSAAFRPTLTTAWRLARSGHDALLVEMRWAIGWCRYLRFLIGPR